MLLLIGTAFVAGLISFVSPCVLPLVPAYISYMSGVSVDELIEGASRESARRAGIRSLFFVLGFSAVFITMGATATSLGEALIEHRDILMKIGGVVIIIFGLHMLGVFKIKALYAERRFHVRLKSVGYLGAFLMGLMFAFGWTPCVGPVLGTILGMAASTDTVMNGIALLAVYSLGLGVPFILTGFLTNRAFAAMNRIKPHFRKIEIASGLLLIAVGYLVFTGSLQEMAGRLQGWFSS